MSEIMMSHMLLAMTYRVYDKKLKSTVYGNSRHLSLERLKQIQENEPWVNEYDVFIMETGGHASMCEVENWDLQTFFPITEQDIHEAIEANIYADLTNFRNDMAGLLGVFNYLPLKKSPKLHFNRVWRDAVEMYGKIDLLSLYHYMVENFDIADDVDDKKFMHKYGCSVRE